MTIILDRILDSTLREGTQTPGVIFSAEESKTLAEKLYFVLKNRGHKGSFIEIGHPYNPVLRPQVERVASHFKERGYDDVTLVGHCRTLRRDVDMAWKIMEKLKHPGVCVYMSISEKHLSLKVEKSYGQALRTIEDVVWYCKYELGFPTVAYTAEDATSTPLERLIEVANVVRDAGADIYRVADTKGQMLPSSFGKLIKGLVKNTDIPLDVHCHNDLHFAIANSLAGLEAGATGVHTTVLGLGERAGITPFSGLVAVLEEGYGIDTKVNKEKLYGLGKYVSAISEIRIPPKEPVIGENIPIHKAGPHQKSVIKDPSTYEPFKPEDYGRKREFEIGPMVSKELVKIMFDVDGEQANKIAERLRHYSAEKGGRPLRKGEVGRILSEEFGIEKNIAYLNEGFGGVVGIKTKPQVFSGGVANKINRISLDADYTISKIYNVTGEFELWLVIGNCKDQETYERVLSKIKEIPGVDKTITMTILDEY